MSDDIREVAALEACIGKTPGPMHLKVIDHLDEGAMRWIASSPLFFAGFGDRNSDQGIAVTLGGGEPGFVRVVDATRLRVPLASLDEPLLARVGMGFGALFLAHGIGETLRLNGRVATANGDEIEIAIEECYLHCAKALIRSQFWESPLCADVPVKASGFLAASRLLALATMDLQGRMGTVGT